MASKSHDQFIEEISKLTVLELSELVKALEVKFGVSAAASMSASSAASSEGEVKKEEEKSEYKVELVDAGDPANKIKVIKAVRAANAALGLAEAKAAVENVPSVISEAASKDDAKKMKDAIEAAGATVKLS